jgi:hypothetical protein
MPEFKDLFSKHSGAYAKFRPGYPPELIEYISSLVEDRRRAWDCGTGNGQAAVLLARHFPSVTATDPSSEQIKNATVDPRVEYRIATAEDSGLPAQSVDLTSVAQAFHWFKHEQFALEVERVSRPKSILAVWCYGQSNISPAVNRVVFHLYQNILGTFWEKERVLVDEGYKSIQLPFQELQTPRFVMRVNWTLEHWLGYLQTWSALQKYMAQNARSPLEDMLGDLKSAWGSVETQPISWDLTLRVWRIRP